MSVFVGLVEYQPEYVFFHRVGGFLCVALLLRLHRACLAGWRLLR